MTKREFYTAIVNGEMNDELRQFASAQIARMNEANEKHRNEPTKKQIENEAIKAKILKCLNDEPKTASTIALEIEISVQKASALLKQLVNEEKAIQNETKIPKKGIQKIYKIK